MGSLTSKDLEFAKLRTRALIKTLMQTVSCENPNQFGAWINRESEKLGWPDTQSSNKWRHLLNGRLKKPPVEVLRLLCQIFPNADKLYYDGPANLWRALWGDVRDPNVLWPLCRTRLSAEGPHCSDTQWIEAETRIGFLVTTFRETIREFEGQLLFDKTFKNRITLNHLTEAISLYRLHQAINCLAFSDIDGVGAYRCVQICLSDLEIQSQLHRFDGYHIVREELLNMEISRLTTEHSYFQSVGIERHQIALYAMDPLQWIDDDSRWNTLDLEWAPAAERKEWFSLPVFEIDLPETGGKAPETNQRTN